MFPDPHEVPAATPLPAAAGTFRLIACPTLTHDARTDTYCVAGRTLGAYLRDLGWRTDGLTARVFIDGRYVPDAAWESTEPKAGQAVVVRRIMTGGDGQTGKQVGSLIGMIALLVAAWYVGGGALSAFASSEAMQMALGAGTALSQVMAASVLVSGMLAMNARTPAPRPRRLAVQP